MRDEVIKWINEQNYLDQMIEYLKLPSRSSYPDECRVSTEHAIGLLRSAGLEPKLYETDRNPIVVAQNQQIAGNPTVLIYGHHDVQPEGDLEDWDTEPFEPLLKDGKLYGRGTADNKGQHFAHIMAIQYMFENHKELFDKINLKIILDGDEELGSPTMRPFVLENKDLLNCDFILISDGPSLTPDGPTLVGAVRGIVALQITISHNQSDLHSGNFGGVARSATLDLKNLLNTMIDQDGYCLVENFYDDINEQSELEKTALKDLEGVYEQNIKTYGITPAIKTRGKSIPFLNEAWPTMNINGLSAGGVNKKRRTIIPQKAIASIDCRLVHNQDPKKILDIIKNHVSKWAKNEGIDENSIEIESENHMAPPPSSLDSPYTQIVKEAVAKGFGKEPRLVPRLGGSLPTSLFPEILEKPAILFPLSLPDSRNHGPNENVDIAFLESGIASSVILLHRLATDNN